MEPNWQAPFDSQPTAVAQPPKLLQRMRDHLRTRHYSIRTETAYLDWARRFIVFHEKRHPQDMGALEVASFLTHLAVERHVSASTQNQAKSAILYLYKEVLQAQLPWLDEVVQAKTHKRLPVDRVTALPENLIAPLQAQLQKAKALHEKDLNAGFGRIHLPHALVVK